MSTKTPQRTGVRRASSLAVLAATLLVVAGCGTTEEGAPTESPASSAPGAQNWQPGQQPPRTPATIPPTPPPAVAEANRSDPTAVIETALTVWFSWDTRTDSGPNDAAARAGDLLSDQFADEVTGSTAIKPPGLWLEWAARDAVVTPVLQPSAQPTPETPGKAMRMYAVRLVAATPDGQPVGEQLRSVAVIAQETWRGWEVTTIQQL